MIFRFCKIRYSLHNYNAMFSTKISSDETLKNIHNGKEIAEQQTLFTQQDVKYMVTSTLGTLERH